MEFIPFVALLISVGGLTVAFLMYQMNKENSINNKTQIENFKINCITTLQNDVDNIKEDTKNIKINISKLFDENKEVSDRISKIEGYLKINGNK